MYNHSMYIGWEVQCLRKKICRSSQSWSFKSHVPLDQIAVVLSRHWAIFILNIVLLMKGLKLFFLLELYQLSVFFPERVKCFGSNLFSEETCSVIFFNAMLWKMKERNLYKYLILMCTSIFQEIWYFQNLWLSYIWIVLGGIIVFF